MRGAAAARTLRLMRYCRRAELLLPEDKAAGRSGPHGVNGLPNDMHGTMARHQFARGKAPKIERHAGRKRTQCALRGFPAPRSTRAMCACAHDLT